MGWNAQLHVVPCGGWDRNMLFPETGNLWVMPSLGLPRFDSALLYPGTCLFEGTNLSEGRGTTAPFEIVGAPFVEAEKLADEMNGMKLPGVMFRPVYFKPTFSKHEAFEFLPPHKGNKLPFIDLLGGDDLYRSEPLDLPALLEQFREEARSFADMKQQYHIY
ncbi:hypothetical protein BGX30_002256 [Mortierella sp. GBA39]|nr:hypothetical protein BGX30_002256 [Mortierella sp. GBA39]